MATGQTTEGEKMIDPNWETLVDGWDDEESEIEEEKKIYWCCWSTSINFHAASFLCNTCRRYYCQDCYDAHVCDVSP